MTTQAKKVRTRIRVRPATGSQSQKVAERERPRVWVYSPVGAAAGRGPTMNPGGGTGRSGGGAGAVGTGRTAAGSTDGVYDRGTVIGRRQTGHSTSPPAAVAGTST